MTQADAATLARALLPIFSAQVARHIEATTPWRGAADAVVAAVGAGLGATDDETLRALRETARDVSVQKSAAILAGAPAVAAVLDAGVMILSGLECAGLDPEEARYSVGAALVALADADVERNEEERGSGAAIIDRDAALAPLRLALQENLQVP